MNMTLLRRSLSIYNEVKGLDLKATSVVGIVQRDTLREEEEDIRNPLSPEPMEGVRLWQHRDFKRLVSRL